MKILQMTDITKRFFGVTVLNHVSFDVEEGEVHALLGENGAGKSTLMNILGGVHQRDGGAVEFCGRPMENISVKAADEAGIAFVHQELNVINDPSNGIASPPNSAASCSAFSMWRLAT